MARLVRKFLFVFLVAAPAALGGFALSNSALAADGFQVSISLKNDDLPASDLVYEDHGARRILSPEEAFQLRQERHLDLSTLDPDPSSDLWKGPSTSADQALDQALPIQPGDTVTFLAKIGSSSGRYRFNVQVLTADGSVQTLTLMLSKELHTVLLRKELLRKLGYRVPAMKYLPRITVRFPNELTRDMVVRDIPEATYGATSRWEADPAQASNSLAITFQDMVATEATPPFYNLALGPPIDLVQNPLIPNSTDIRPEGPRILRALALPYALANFPENINQVDWYAARVQDSLVNLTVPDQANFACTLDDARWMLRRIAKLTRDDLEEVVAASYFPEPVAKLVLEKLTSRRNSLFDAFGESASALVVDPALSDGKALKKGKLTQQDWKGYGSRFAYGDPQSPLQDLKWYVLSEAESNLMSNLIARANELIPSWSVSKDIQKHQQDLYNAGFAKYLKSGDTQAIPLGFWAAPLASAGVDISRDVVLGSYLGTNNLVQLADTFGFHADVGLLVGVDGLPEPFSLQGVIHGSLGISLTHIKPLSGLKQAVTEPIQNEFVPWIFRHASGVFKDISKLQPQQGSAVVSPEDLKKNLEKELGELRKFLGVGESLILTESLSGAESLSASVHVPMAPIPAFALQGGANQVVISRLHFYRKDADTIQVFKDNGKLGGIALAFQFTFGGAVHFPILTVNTSRVTGDVRSKVFTVDVNPDPSQNPGVYASASALGLALRTGSVEVLESLQSPTRLAIHFTDHSTTAHLLWWQSRLLKTNSQVEITLPDGTSAKFLSLTDGAQSGTHHQRMATEVANFLVQTLTKSGDLGFDTQAAPDPGQSFLGHSQTREATFQARTDSGVTDASIQVSYRWEGWNISAKKAQKLTDKLSKQYGVKLYPDHFLTDTRAIRMYQLELSLQIYEPAILEIVNMAPKDQIALERKYGTHLLCYPFTSGTYEANFPPVDRGKCEAIQKFEDAFNAYRRGTRDPIQLSKNVFGIVANLERFADFPDFVRAAGGIDNLFVRSMISGFRMGSENMMDPIYSNTLGQMNPDNPTGVLNAAQQILGIGAGEFDGQWIRNHL